MATLGIDSMKLALIDSVTNKVLTGVDGINGLASDQTGLFTIDADSSKGIVSIALSNMSGAFTPIYGSNKLVWQSQGKAQPQAVVTVNDMPLEIKARMLGQTTDGKGGYALAGTNSAHLAVLFKTAKAFASDEDVYYALYSVQASEGALNINSNTQTESRSQDAITLSASERGTDGFGKLFDASEKTFTIANMMNDVFLTTAPVSGN